MDEDGVESGMLPGMEGDNAPIPEENTVRVIGRLVKLPRTQQVAGGYKMATFMLAVPRTFHNGEGRKVRENAYVPVVGWRAIAEQIAPLGKDSAVLIEGRLRTWSMKEGKGFRWEVEAMLLEVLERREPAKDAGRGAASAREKEAAA